MMPAPPPTTYPAPAHVPQQPALPAAAPAQPKPLIRAQAPEEPKPARPPLLTLPAPEQLGVSVRPVENSADWTAIHARMREMGVVSFHMDKLPDGRSRFICWMPSDRPDLTRRIESVAATEAEAVHGGLQEAAKSAPACKAEPRP
jgi:hypothetical protein